MKKILLSIFAVMLAVFSVQAEEVAFVASGANSSATNNVTLSGNLPTGDADYVGFSMTKVNQNTSNVNSGLLRWYKSDIVNLTPKNGAKITKVVIVTGGGSKYQLNVTPNVGSSSINSGIVTWNGETTETLKLTASEGQVRCSTITVTYEVGGGETPDVPVVETVATPVISAESTTFNEGESLFVTIETETEGAEIYYTLDGSDPVENGDPYEGEIELTATTTVKAVAMLDGWNNSAVASATFTAVDPNAKTATFDFTNPAGLTPSVPTAEISSSNGYPISEITFTNNGVTINTTNGSTPSRIWGTSAHDLRVYKNATMTIAAPAGGVLTSVEFTGSAVSNFSANIGELNGKVWTGSASSVVFTWASGASTQKISTITVTYSIDESVVIIDQPSIAGEATFVGSTTVEITNNAEGTTLYYSTNGEDYVAYTGALNISETTTVYAKAVDAQGNESSVAEATFTKLETLSIADAKAAYDAAGENVDVAVDLTGAVVTVNNGQYLFIENETTGINIFNSGADYAEGTKFTAGYILGTSTTYRNMHQLSNVEFCGVETTTVTVEPLEVAIADIAGNYDEYEGRFVKLTGVSIDKDKNMTQGDDEYKAYDRFALGFGAIANCDVTGVVAIYNTGEQLYIKDITYNLSVTDAGYATLFLDFNAAIPTNVEAYAVTKVNNGYVTLTQVEGVLPANTGVIVKATEDDYTFAYSTKTPATVTGNLLQGTATATEIDVEAYVLGNVDGVGLYKADMAGGVWLNNANKAYLPASVASGAASYSFRFGEGTTGIEQITDNREQSTVIYDLTGRRVEEITAPGIYIVGGKKVLVK